MASDPHPPLPDTWLFWVALFFFGGLLQRGGLVLRARYCHLMSVKVFTVAVAENTRILDEAWGHRQPHVTCLHIGEHKVAAVSYLDSLIKNVFICLKLNTILYICCSQKYLFIISLFINLLI